MDVVVPLLSALLGGVLVHLLSMVRDSRNAQRTRRIEYLVSAYQRLVDASERSGAMSPDRVTAVESAIADVLLLGQRAEVTAAASLIEAWAHEGKTNLIPVLDALRTSLRRELKLDATPMPELWNLRLEPSSASTSPRRRPPK